MPPRFQDTPYAVGEEESVRGVRTREAYLNLRAQRPKVNKAIFAKPRILEEVWKDESLRDIAFEKAQMQFPSDEAMSEQFYTHHLALLRSKRADALGSQPGPANLIDEGAHKDVEDVFMTEDQQQALNQGEKYHYTPDQVANLMAQKLGGDRGAEFLQASSQGYSIDLDPDELDMQTRLQEPQYSPPSHMPESIRKVAGILGTGGRYASGYAKGFQEELLQDPEIAAAASVVEDPEKTAPWKNFMRQLGGGIREALFDVQTPHGTIVTDPTAKKYIGGAAEMAFAPMRVAGAVLTNAKIAGVPAGTALGQLMTDPKLYVSAIYSGLKGGLAHAGELDIGTMRSSTAMFVDLKEQYRDSAIEVLKQRHGEAVTTMDSAQLEAESEQIFKQLVDQDAASAFIDDPDMGDMFIQLVADPVNFLGGAIGKGVVGGAKLAGHGLAPVGQAVGKGAMKVAPKMAPRVAERAGAITEGLKGAFSRRFAGQKGLEELTAAPELGITATGKEVGERMQLAVDQAKALGQKTFAQAEPYLKTMAKVHPEDEALAFRLAGVGENVNKQLAEDLIALGTTNPKRLKLVIEATEANVQLAKLTQPARSVYGGARKFSKAGELTEGAYKGRQRYRPEMVPDEAVDPAAVRTYGAEIPAGAMDASGTPKTADLMPGAEKLRIPKAKRVHVPKESLGEQWAARTGQYATKATRAVEAREAAKRLADEGFIRVAASDPLEFKKQMQTLEKATGGKWDVLKTHPIVKGAKLTTAQANHNAFVKEFLRVTGDVGKTKVGDAIVLPKAATEYFTPLLSVAKNTEDAAKVANMYNTFMRNTWRPFSKAWRTGSTILGGPAYFLRNMGTAVQLPLVAHGVKGLNPRNQWGAIRGALASGTIGEKSARKMTFKLADDSTFTMGQALDELEKVGMLNTGDLRIGLDIETKGLLSAPSNLMDKAASTLSPFMIPMGKKASARNVNNMIENYQKLATYLGFLKGTSRKHLDEALTKTAEYAGHYARLSDFEKTVMRDVTGFYSWSRFIMPHITKQLVKNPQRFTPYLKARGYLDAHNKRKSGANVYSAEGTQKWTRMFGVMGPKMWQPPQADEGGNFGHEFVMMHLDDPMAAGLGLALPLLQGFSGQGDLDYTRDRAMQLGAATSLAFEMLTGRDPKTGQLLPAVPGIDGEDVLKSLVGDDVAWEKVKREVNTSALGKALMAPINRPTKNFMAIYKLYGTQGHLDPSQVDIMLRYQAGRSWPILSKLFNAISGEERALGTGGPVSTYYQHGAENLARTKRAGLKQTQRRERQRERGGF